MPLFDFSCQACQHQFEYLVRGNESPICPQCGDAKLTRHLGVPAAHTRGSGSLPVSSPSPGTCGRTACAMGGCQGM